MRKLKPVTPGELLLEEFLVPMGITQYRLAKEIGVPAQRIGEIVAGRLNHSPGMSHQSRLQGFGAPCFQHAVN